MLTNHYIHYFRMQLFSCFFPKHKNMIPIKNQIELFSLDGSGFQLYGIRGAFRYPRQTRSIPWANQDLGLSFRTRH